MDERIKVTDKRMFTPEGELRDNRKSGGSDGEMPEDRVASAESAKAPEADPTMPETAASNATSAERPVEAAPTEHGRKGDTLPSPRFMDLVGLLAQPIAMFLGDASLPGGEAEENLPLARFHIDLLELVQSKTRGNITQEEARLLEDLLYQMRMRYVEKAG